MKRRIEKGSVVLVTWRDAAVYHENGAGIGSVLSWSVGILVRRGRKGVLIAQTLDELKNWRIGLFVPRELILSIERISEPIVDVDF